MESLVPQHRLLRLVHSMLHPLIDSLSDLVRPAHGLACPSFLVTRAHTSSCFSPSKKGSSWFSSLCFFLAGWTSGPTRRSARPSGRPAWSTGRTFGSTRWTARSTRRSFGPARRSARPPRWPTRSAGRAFGSTRWSFRAPTWGTFLGRLRRLLSGCSRTLLRPAVRTEIGGFIGELSTTIRTEGGYFYFIGELHTAIRTEVGRFVGELSAAVGAKPLFIRWLYVIWVVCRLHGIWVIRWLYEIRVICWLQSALCLFGHL